MPNSMKLLGEFPGATPGSEVHAGNWYGFRNPMTLTLLIEETATSPIGLRYVLGRVPDDQRQPDSTEAALQAVEARNIKIEGEEEYVKLFWQTDQQIIKADPATMHIFVYENDYFEPRELMIEGDAVGWSFIRLSDIPQNLNVRLSETSSPDVTTVAPGSDLSHEQWCGFKQVLKLKVALREKVSSEMQIRFSIHSGEAELANDARSAAIAAIKRGDVLLHGKMVPMSIFLELPSLTSIAKTFLSSPWGIFLIVAAVIGILWVLLRKGWRHFRVKRRQLEEPKAKELELGGQTAELASSHSPPTAHGKTGWKSRLSSLFQFGQGHREASRGPSYSELEERLRVLTQAVAKTSQAQPVAVAVSSLPSDITQSVQSHTKQLREIEQKLVSLEGLVLNAYKTKDRLVEIEQMLETRVSPPSNRALEEQVVAKMNQLVEELHTDIGKQAQLTSAQIEGLEQAMSQLLNKLREQQAHADENRRLLEEYSQQVRQLASEPQRSAEPRADLNLPREETQDRLYARLLGLIFAGNIESLKKDGFDVIVRRAGETLNQFFQEGLPLAHNLQDLDTHVKNIAATVEAVLNKGAAIKKEAYGDLRLAAERARRLSREITSIQTQLQNREIQLDLQIRVSTTPAGHAIFLEEMGRAVKQAIDKFTDPQAYIERRLDRFVLGEIAGVVNLCDHDIAPPGENEELERALKELFQAAQLRPILPIAMEPFQPTEHNIAELVSGGRSQAIARVLRRGFYYKDQVIRKADVAVYK
ncbi:MAG: nucleotide exchange factor GrpE [Acidobacteria bacterium]|nr:nucleotide exchange factor GrpE [Acidobacteriota bacterium]